MTALTALADTCPLPEHLRHAGKWTCPKASPPWKCSFPATAPAPPIIFGGASVNDRDPYLISCLYRNGDGGSFTVTAFPTLIITVNGKNWSHQEGESFCNTDNVANCAYSIGTPN